MSLKTAVGVTPVLVLFGSQNNPQTVVNTGNKTAYLGDDSTVTAGNELALGVGSSLVVDAGTVLWAVCAAGESTTLTTLVNYNDRFAVGAPVGRLLGSFVYNGTNSQFIDYYPDSTIESQVPGVFIVARSMGRNVRFASGVYTLTMNETSVNTLGSQAPWPANVHSLSMYLGNPSLNTNFDIAQYPVFGGYFPNYGGGPVEAYVSCPASTLANAFELSMYATNYPVVQTQPMVNDLNGAMTLETYTYISNTWVASLANIVGSGTFARYLPSVPGPVRVMCAYTQTGAGAVTAKVSVLADGVNALQYADSLVSSSTAGAQFGSAQFGVWPTAPVAVIFTVPAGVTLSNIKLAITSGVQ